MNPDRLRWCPDCGQVEIDEPGVDQVIRRGDDRCTEPQEEWPRGSVQECNRYFGPSPYARALNR
jgi:hypothetical protein